jgi:hypothetical protein
VAPDVGEGFLSDWRVVVAVRLAGAAEIVVATPSTVVRTGVTVATGEPLASTEIQGSSPSAETTYVRKL